MSDLTVHTIDSRGNVMLEVLQDHFELNNEQVRHEIVESVKAVMAALHSRGVEYAELRSALTPQANRREIALLFDTLRIPEDWYGYEVHKSLLPLLGPRSSHSVLEGDLLGSDEHQLWIRASLEAGLVPGNRPLDYKRSNQFYCVYLNNCSDEMVRTLHDGLLPLDSYAGLVDVTLSSDFKTYLSTCLVNAYLKHRQTIIQPHEDDLPDDANQNTLGYAFEDFGLACRSIGAMYFGLLLSYKIERPVFAGFERDQIHSLNAISSRPADIAKLSIEIEDSKFGYLCREKTGTLRRLGVLGKPKAALGDLIRAKLMSNYIYNMRFQEDYSVATFNILLELQAIDTGEPVRALASFEYQPDRQTIRLITFY